jgi:hypothetical protein
VKWLLKVGKTTREKIYALLGARVLCAAAALWSCFWKKSMCAVHTSKKLFSQKRRKCKFQGSILNLRSKYFEYKTLRTKVCIFRLALEDDEFISKDKQQFAQSVVFSL